MRTVIMNKRLRLPRIGKSESLTRVESSFQRGSILFRTPACLVARQVDSNLAPATNGIKHPDCLVEPNQKYQKLSASRGFSLGRRPPVLGRRAVGASA